MELRIKDDHIEEITADGCSLHVKRMSGDGWFFGIEAADGTYWQFWIGAANYRSRVDIRHAEKDGHAVIPPMADSAIAKLRRE